MLRQRSALSRGQSPPAFLSSQLIDKHERTVMESPSNLPRLFALFGQRRLRWP